MNVEQRIAKLEKEISDLKSFASLPLEFQRTLESRGFKRLTVISDPPAGYQRTISLTGLVQDITVLDYPVRWGRVDSEINMFVPLYVIEE